MTSARPYQAARSEDDVLDELRRCAGSQFDPVVVDALVAELTEESAAVAVATGDQGSRGASTVREAQIPTTTQAPGGAD
jgi:HD-GYP domain-containing protein (c-di-GMP phosphodiesterase class II)